MPFVNKDRLGELEAAEARIPGLLDQLDRAQAVGRVANLVTTEIGSLVEAGTLLDHAEQMAYVAVVQTVRDEKTAEIAEGLKDEARARAAADIERDEVPSITRELDETYKANGTYSTIRDEEEDAARDRIRTSLLEDHRAAVRIELDTDEARERYVGEVTTELRESGELDRIRARVEEELHTEWHPEAVEAAKAGVREEVEATKPAYLEQAGRRWLGTWDGKRYRESLEARMQDEWTPEAIGMVKDEELRALLERKATRDKAKLEKEERAAELLGHFERLGVSTTEIAADAQMVIHLGEIKTATIKERRRDERWNDWRDVEVEKRGVFYERELTLTSLGDGRFVVRTDSLDDSDSSYEQQFSITPGTVITLGRMMREDGTPRLEPRIAADVELHFDDDTTTPEEFVGMLVPVANITVDGVPAREVEFTKKAR